jgi:putative Mn2+ efflux pump MntP
VSPLEICLIALALSIDAFAVSLAVASAGLANGARPAFRLSFHFGLFQFMMPILGWAAGATLEPLIAAYDHWIAFFLLLAVGIRMIRSSANPSGNPGLQDPTRGWTLFSLAVATSIDALAVGLSLAMLQVEVWTPSIIIGAVASTMSLVGIFLGTRLQVRFGRAAQYVGSGVLILIAIRIVLTHTILAPA